MNEVILTVGDHEKNGCIHLARWAFATEAAARIFIAEQDAIVDADAAEPDVTTSPFTFILDLMAGNYDLIDTGERNLPLQNAMALAPEQVRRWLDERPEPDDCISRPVPLLRAAASGGTRMTFTLSVIPAVNNPLGE